MKAQEFTIVELKQDRKQTAKTRNPVAKNLGVTASGAGAHKDKKRDAKTGVEKHKKDYAVENSHLSEISKSTLGSYVKKSAFDAAKKGVQLGGSTKQDTSAEQDAVLKRQRGISKATDRLVRTEAYDGDPNEYFVLRHRSKRDIENEITVTRLWSKIKQFDSYQEAIRARDEMTAKHPGERFTVTTHKKPSVAESLFYAGLNKNKSSTSDQDRKRADAASAERVAGREASSRAWSKAQSDAYKAGKDTFTFNGKTYPLKGPQGPVAEGLSPQQKRAHQANLDAAQQAMDRREAEGEDMTGATIDQKTYKIIKPKSSGVTENDLNTRKYKVVPVNTQGK